MRKCKLVVICAIPEINGVFADLKSKNLITTDENGKNPVLVEGVTSADFGAAGYTFYEGYYINSIRKKNSKETDLVIDNTL